MLRPPRLTHKKLKASPMSLIPESTTRIDSPRKFSGIASKDAIKGNTPAMNKNIIPAKRNAPIKGTTIKLEKKLNRVKPLKW